MKRSEDLFNLIKSMDKGEKRYFRLISSLQKGSKNYLRLYDAVAGQKTDDERAIRERFRGEAFTRQLSVAKNHLYGLVLDCLRQYRSDPVNELANMTENARLLYDRCLYAQCHKLIRKAKEMAGRQEHFALLLDLLRLEQLVLPNLPEARTDGGKALRRAQQAAVQKLTNFEAYSSLMSEVFNLHVHIGFARNGRARRQVSRLMADPLLRRPGNALSHSARIYHHRIKWLGSLMMSKKDNMDRQSRLEERIFVENPGLARRMPRQYLACLSNHIVTTLLRREFPATSTLLDRMRRLPETTGDRSKLLAVRSYSRYVEYKMTLCVESGAFEEGVRLSGEFLDGLGRDRFEMDGNRILIIYYNSAVCHLGCGNHSGAIAWINRAMENEEDRRADIYCFIRILNLIIHFEAGNELTLPYLVRSTYRYLYKRDRLYKVEDLILAFLRKMGRIIAKSDQEEAFRILLEEMRELADDPFERTAFEYFDFVSWLEARISGRNFADVVRQKASMHAS